MPTTRLAILGTGSIAGRHAAAFLNRPDDCAIVALVDLADATTRAFLARMNFASRAPALPQTFTDPAAMYRAAAPDAVVICTPHTLHADQTLQALDHGCHALVEKPMATTAADARRVAARAAQTRRVVTVGYNTPCSPEFLYLRELIRSGELGRLEVVTGWLAQGWMKGTAGKWRQDPALSGGGIAYDSAAHAFCSLTWAVESPLAQAFAFVHPRPPGPGPTSGAGVDINSVVSLRFENGVFASMTVAGNCPADAASMTFMFENGRVEVDPWSAAWIRIWKGRQPVKYPPIPGDPVSAADNFLDAIHGRAAPRTTPEDGIRHAEVMDAIYESARTGMPVEPNRPG